MEDELDPHWLLRHDVQRAIAAVDETVIVFGLLVREPQLPAAVETVRRHPEVRFVLDHVAKRPRDERSWEDGVTALSHLPNLTCKLSGLFAGCDFASWRSPFDPDTLHSEIPVRPA